MPSSAVIKCFSAVSITHRRRNYSRQLISWNQISLFTPRTIRRQFVIWGPFLAANHRSEGIQSRSFFFFSFLTQKLVLMKQVYRYFHVPTFHRYPFPKVPKGKRQSFPSPPIERLCIHTYMTWRRRKFTAPKRVQNSKRVVGECLPVTQLSAGKWL